MWTLRIRIIWHRSQKSRIQRGRSATTSGGVLEAYSSQKPQFAMVRLSMWKGLSNNAEGKAKRHPDSRACDCVHGRLMRRERPKSSRFPRLWLCAWTESAGDKSPLKTDVTGASASCKRSLAIMKVHVFVAKFWISYYSTKKLSADQLREHCVCTCLWFVPRVIDQLCATTMHCGDDVFPLYLTPFYKPHSPKYGDSTLGVKANRSAPECIGSKADYLKAELSAEWMRLWRYERGIRENLT